MSSLKAVRMHQTKGGCFDSTAPSPSGHLPHGRPWKDLRPAPAKPTLGQIKGWDLILEEALIRPNNLVMACFFSFCKRKGVSGARQTLEADDEVSRSQNICCYTHRELQMATDNFNSSKKVGEGGFGSVYKGILKDGTEAAIKVLSAESRQGLREFLTEIKVIADIEHNNLVKLYGYCADGNHRILVYGYNQVD
ncbi:hypothetical protein SADUNF_Sadunf16G0258300 [Salix dunnii]|uniref:Protein kinase domain-containing protein n=1 Tax=Salix dunnii TaxID=1413687 RepID=A0A835J8S6_9ROSI|nr:hypothetical protein SADUNF_Sadunf16G0258300 [Salix dunnii]